VVVRVLHLEGVASFADLIVGLQLVGVADGPVAVDVEVAAHADGKGLEV
jgi:hypothetical protein